MKIPSDCPLIDPGVIDRVLGFFVRHAADVDFVEQPAPSHLSGRQRRRGAALRGPRDGLARGHPAARARAHHALRLGPAGAVPHRQRPLGRRARSLAEPPLHGRLRRGLRPRARGVRRAVDAPRGPIFRLHEILDLLAARPDLLALNARHRGVNWYRHHLDELATIGAGRDSAPRSRGRTGERPAPPSRSATSPRRRGTSRRCRPWRSARARARHPDGHRRRLLHRRLAVVRRPARPPLHAGAARHARARSTEPRPRLPVPLEGPRRARALRHPRRARLPRPRAARPSPAHHRLDLLAPQPRRARRRVPLRLARPPALGGASASPSTSVCAAAPNRVFVVLGDGELDEGSIWEACLVAAAQRLDNLVAVVDRNGFQANVAHRGAGPARAARRQARGLRLERAHRRRPRLRGARRDAFAAACRAAGGRPPHRDRRAHTVRGKGLPSIEARADRWFVQLHRRRGRGAAARAPRRHGAPRSTSGRPCVSADELRGRPSAELAAGRDRRRGDDGREPGGDPQPAGGAGAALRRRRHLRADDGRGGGGAGAARPHARSSTRWPPSSPCAPSSSSAPTSASRGLPVKLVGGVPGFLSEANGPTHQAIEDVALMRGIPGMHVVCPADEEELLAALPAILACPRPATCASTPRPPAVAHHAPFALGQGRAALREGDDVALLTYGFLVREVRAARRASSRRGRAVRRASTCAPCDPLDEEALLAPAASRRLLVTVEDHFLRRRAATRIVAELLRSARGLRAPRPDRARPALVPARPACRTCSRHEGFTGPTTHRGAAVLASASPTADAAHAQPRRARHTTPTRPSTRSDALLRARRRA